MCVYPKFFYAMSERGGLGVKVVKKINTSAVLAIDSAGETVVVFGKGIGFPPVPYELNDLNRVQRIFYGIDSRYYSLIAELPQSIVMLSAEVADEAEIQLRCRLNPNLAITLADHLNFALKRFEKGLSLAAPIAYDIEHLYQREYTLGLYALELLKEQTGTELPKVEAVNVAMHLINAEAEVEGLQSVLRVMEIMDAVEKVIEGALKITLDRESFYYSRFTMHLRYLIQRLESGKQMDLDTGGMLPALAGEFPEVHRCALAVADYFREELDWECNQEEILYLMLHINRMWEKAVQD